MAGDLVRLADGPLEVELLPAIGARLHRIRAFGRDLLRTPPDPASHRREPFSWGGYVMAPWCNRIPAVPTTVGDRVIRPRANFPDGSAIHGQVYERPWEPGADGEFRTRSAGTEGWPWPFEVTERIDVADGHVRIALALTNLAATPMPGGLGLHPWFVRPLDVAIEARGVVPSNTDPSATDRPLAAADERLDLRVLRPVPIGLDATWTDVRTPGVTLRWPDLGLVGTLRAAARVPICVALASPDESAAVAIEPETHAPQGLRRFLRGEPFGLAELAPGATLRLDIDLEIRQDVG